MLGGTSFNASPCDRDVERDVLESPRNGIDTPNRFSLAMYHDPNEATASDYAIHRPNNESTK